MHAPLKGNIRRCVAADIPWMLSLAQEAYPETDAATLPEASQWIEARMKQPDIVFLRGERSVGVANLQQKFYAPGRLQAYLLFLYATREHSDFNVWEPFYILDALQQWAKLGKASCFWFGDVTGFDFEAYAKRRGGRLAGRTYVIDLDGAGRPFG